LLGRLGKSGAIGKLAAQPGEAAEDIQAVVQLIGMEVVHRADADFNDAVVAADVELQLQVEPTEHVVDTIGLDGQRFAFGQVVADLDFAAIGPRGKIAEDRQAKHLASLARLLRRHVAQGSEIEFIFHGVFLQFLVVRDSNLIRAYGKGPATAILNRFPAAPTRLYYMRIARPFSRPLVRQPDAPHETSPTSVSIHANPPCELHYDGICRRRING